MPPLQPVALKCEHLDAPLGLNTPAPRFSWALAGEGRGRRQSAYQIVAGTDREAVAAGQGTLWDSGRVASHESLLIPYAGSPLTSDIQVFWSVAVWDEAGQPSGFAEPASIHTGLIDQSDWHASWIARYFVLPSGREPPADSPYDNPWQARPADYLRRDFVIDKPVRRAVIYASALGVYELHLNGHVIGDAVLAPGWTDYHTRVEYQLHDVTADLTVGVNVVGAVLGEGWYSGRVGGNRKKAGMHYGGRPAFIAQLHIDYADGTSQRLVTDGSWKTGLGPIAFSDFLIGETHNASFDITGWDTAAFDATSWQPCEEFVPEPRPPRLEAARAQPVRRKERFKAAFLGRSGSGELIYDAGQNLAGWVRLEVSARPGDRFVLRHAEMLDPDGALYVANLRSALATDTFVAGGAGREVFEPHFTFHGFRYVGITAPADVDPATIDVTAVALYSDTPLTGQFECGDAMVNQLASNILWSQRGNFLSVPTDCPQRDERLGWTADAQVFVRTAGFNMDVAAFFTKWMVDVEDGQLADGAFTDIAPTKPLNPYRLTAQPGAPGWGDGGIIIPWEIYVRYGDRAILSRHYAAMTRWMDYIERHNPDLVRRNAVHNNYGDWLSVGPASDRALVATAYWIHITDLMARIATVLGRQDDAARYADLLQRQRAVFAATFVAADGRLTGDTQTAYLLALDFGALSGEARAAAARHLVRKIDEAGGHLQTGFLGVRHLCPVLSDIGAVDRAYQLLLNDTYPSWGFSIRQGATTIWERWDGWTPEQGFQSPNMNSFNHYAYGSVGEWIFARVAGIDTDEAAPGFRSIRFRPLFDPRIGWCKAAYQAHVGSISSAWEMDGAEVRWRIVVPANCTGRIEVAGAANAVRVDGVPLDQAEGISDISESGGQLSFACTSGAFDFTIGRA